MSIKMPFNLEHWFMNVFAGSTEAFLAISFLVIAAMAAAFRMPNIITGLSFLLFLTIAGYIAGEWLVVGIIIVSIGIIYGASKLIKN